MNLRQQIHRISIRNDARSLQRNVDQRIIDSPVQSPKQRERFSPIAASKQVEGDFIRILRREGAVENPMEVLGEKWAAKEHEMTVQPAMLEIPPEPHGEAKSHFEGKADKSDVAHKMPEMSSPQDAEYGVRKPREHTIRPRVRDSKRAVDYLIHGSG
jgi:hypothetical protein